jgi:RimJ/RimL family protein N-acetyltransferase
LEQIGRSELPAMWRYLQSHYAENVLLLNDLRRAGERRHQWMDDLSLSGYRLAETVQAVQGFYRFGRWLPHFAPGADPQMVDVLIDEMLRRRTLGKRLSWILGARRVVDPILQRLGPRAHVSYDELDQMLYVDSAALRPCALAGVRRAQEQDQDAVAALRLAFEAEYFQEPPQQINRAWCHHTAGRYIAGGTYLVERDGQVVSMVAVEAALPQLVQVGAVYTVRPYRNQGLARGVVSAICQEALANAPRVALTVRVDNEPALRVYRDLGFAHLLDYRMTRIG